MIRKSIVAILGGMALATILSLAIPASASCYGMCQGRIGNYYYAGCNVIVECTALPCDGPFGSCCAAVGAECFYTEGPAPIDPNVAE